MTHLLLTELGIASRLSPRQDQVLSVTLQNLEDKVSMQLGEIQRINSAATLNTLVHTDNLTRLTKHIARLEGLLTEAGVTYPPAPLLTVVRNVR